MKAVTYDVREGERLVAESDRARELVDMVAYGANVRAHHTPALVAVRSAIYEVCADEAVALDTLLVAIDAHGSLILRRLMNQLWREGRLEDRTVTYYVAEVAA